MQKWVYFFLFCKWKIYTMPIFRAIISRQAFNEPIRISQSSITSRSPCTLGPRYLFTGQNPAYLTSILGVWALNFLQATLLRSTLSPTFRFDPHWCIPRHKFISPPLQFLSVQPLCSNISLLIQPLVLQHLVTAGRQHPAQRQIYFQNIFPNGQLLYTSNIRSNRFVPQTY